jgi:hypothetical protein
LENTVTIKNRVTGVISEVPETLWTNKKNSPFFRGVFEVINTIKEPPEVLALKAKRAEQKRGQ